MNRFTRVPLVLLVVAVLALASTPIAGASPLETPQAIHRNAGGWFEAALRWLDALTGVLRSTPAQKEKPVSEPPPSEITPTGGSCIDPEGRPGPGCL